MLVIQTKNLTKRYGTNEVVKQLNMSIPSGVICGFLGPNGSGKTTTIRMLLGLTSSSEGETFIFGEKITLNNRSAVRKVGALVDSPSFYEHLTGYENLKILQVIHNIEPEKIDKVLKTVEIFEARHKKVKFYSLGMKQRLGIAIALINEPSLLILDEPTNGLDPKGIKDIRELLLNLCKELNISILISSHNLNEIEQICDYICLINKGQLLYQGEIKQLLDTNNGLNSFYINTNKNELAKKILNKFNVLSHIQKNKVRIDNISFRQIGEINRILVNNEITVYEIYHDNITLETKFLSLINEGDK